MLYLGALLALGAVLDALSIAYIFVDRPLGRVLYGVAIVLGVAVIWRLDPWEVWSFVADRLATDPPTWLVRLSLAFVLAAPFLKARRLRRIRARDAFRAQ